MKVRLAVAAGLAAATALSLTAHAGPATLDGKKVKSFTTTLTSTQQDHDQDFVGLSSRDTVNCPAPRCGTIPFTYAPAKGTSGSISFAISWATPGEDYDLYVGQVGKHGQAAEVGNCGGFGGTNEKLVLSGLKPGKYVVVVDYYRTLGSKVTATVSYPAAFSMKTTVPKAVEDNALHVNCSIS